MSANRVDTWVWALVYGGMVLLGLGVAVQRSDASLGWGIAALGVMLVVIGIALIWVRSRMKDKT
jgi:membrane protein DedA with SNARE-associated domain